MSSVPPQSEGNAPASQPPAKKLQRLLACVLCQQRKVKCDRKFPCATCTKNNAQCVPATQARRQRRLFPERELLDRLRKYEELLRRNNVDFESLQQGLASGKMSVDKNPSEDCYESDDERPPARNGSSPSASIASEGAYDVRSVWDAICEESQGPSDSGDYPAAYRSGRSVTASWGQLPDDGHFLLGFHQQPVELHTFHPGPIEIFRLWQIYLENVNPLLKVVHAPTLQTRIIEAASNIKTIRPDLEALLFSIYSISVTSLRVDDCWAMFGLSKDDLLTRYQSSCQRALTNAGFLQSTSRECLTALYLYLLSVSSGRHIQSVCNLFGVAIRIAKSIGIHTESSFSQCSPFETEMRRRLWWSLVLYDARISERVNYNETLLSPTWDCKVPLNVNDSELRPDMKQLPRNGDKATETIFTVVISTIADSVRHTSSHLEATNPELKPLAKRSVSLAALEQKIEQDYLRHCDPDNPIHFMAIRTARLHLAQSHFREQQSTLAESKTRTDTQRNKAMSLSLSMLKCDTEIISSPLTKGYVWFQKTHFPFPAHMHIIHDLKECPLSEQAKYAWEVIDGNCEVRWPPPGPVLDSLLKSYGRHAVLAWEALEAALVPDEPDYLPKVVSEAKQRHAPNMQTTQRASPYPTGLFDSDVDNFFASVPIDDGANDLLLNMENQENLMAIDPRGCLNMPKEGFFVP